MKKKKLILLVGILLIGVNVYAVGDLVVNGRIGVGVTPTSGKLAVIGVNDRAVGVLATTTENNVGAKMIGGSYNVTIDGSVSTDRIIGQTATLAMMSDLSGTVPGGVAATYTFQIGTPDTVGTTDVTEVIGLQYILNRHYNNARTYNVIDSYGFKSGLQQGGSQGTAVNVTNHYHQFLDDPGALSKVNITNLYGMYLEKMTAGTQNYGIVLNGYGSTGDFGAAIVFGDPSTSQSVRLYSKTDGKLYVNDGSFETQHSPHDPVTGEWIFHSTNIKTGKTVRVNMEKLIKAVEKLTGETFMVETLIEEQ